VEVESSRFHGTPEAARNLVWRGSLVPENILLVYTREYVGGSVYGPDYEKAAHSGLKSAPAQNDFPPVPDELMKVSDDVVTWVTK
jgi:hypothetical protein